MAIVGWFGLEFRGEKALILGIKKAAPKRSKRLFYVLNLDYFAMLKRLVEDFPPTFILTK